MRYVEAAGTPFEIGLTQGREAARQIALSLQFAERLSWMDAARTGKGRQFCQTMWSWLSEKFPALAEEMRGIAEGSGIDLETIKELNLAYSAISAVAAGQCTGFAVSSSPEGPIYAKTSDMMDNYAVYLLLRARPAHGLSFLSIRWAGTAWAEVGMNSAGLCCGLNSAPAAPRQEGRGISQHMILRPVLESCSQGSQAVELVQGITLAGGGITVMLADAEGELASLEKTADRQAVIPSRDGALFCVNHYVDPGMRALNDTSGERYRNSLARWELLEKAFHHERQPHTRQTMERLLQCHDEPVGICQHGTHLYTQFGYLLFPARRELWLSNGPPCASRFIHFTA